MSENPIAAGKSSFGLIDPGKLFSGLQLKKDTVFLDLACGSGSYAIAASDYIGKEGAIYAVDLWEEGIDNLLKEIASKRIKHIHASVADINQNIPVENRSIDICLMATVLHDLIQEHTEKGTLREIKRVLKPDGLLAIVEFNKVEGPPGPPLKIRISPEELKKILSAYGFHFIKTTEVGSYNYLSVFHIKAV
jgi:ubiquinone/menaquinone biosynthesis C-methylase UbiE